MDRRSFLKKLPVLGIVPYIGPGIRLPKQKEKRSKCGYWEIDFEQPIIEVFKGNMEWREFEPIEPKKCKVRVELEGGIEILIEGEKFLATWNPPKGYPK